MKQIRTVAVLATITCCFGMVGCADPEPVARMKSPPSAAVNPVPIEGGLIFGGVLQTNDVQMFPTFADMNSNSRLDLVVGTVKGISIQLNESTGEELDFAPAYFFRPPGSENGIPWG